MSLVGQRSGRAGSMFVDGRFLPAVEFRMTVCKIPVISLYILSHPSRRSVEITSFPASLVGANGRKWHRRVIGHVVITSQWFDL